MKSEDFFELRYRLQDLLQSASRERTMVMSMCEGKRRFDTKPEADRVIRKGKPIKSFRCLACRGWHVGSLQTSRENRLALKRRMEALCE